MKCNKKNITKKTAKQKLKLTLKKPKAITFLRWGIKTPLLNLSSKI